jgi:FHA domain/zinc-ribbon domain
MMSACPQCGTPARPTDKFCNACGTPVVHTNQGPPAASPGAPRFATPAPPPFVAAGTPGFGSPPGRAPLPRCQQGHEIGPGASYCTQGHPIALEQMQFASEAYAGGGGFGAPPPGAYAPPLPVTPEYGPPPVAPPFPPPPGPPPFAPPAPPPPYVPADVGRDVAPAKILRGFLVTYATNPSGEFWPLTGGRMVVGRLGSAERVDIAIQDPTISSRHAAFSIDAASGTITVEDTASTNGTFVNDEHIGFNGRRELRDGDRMRFGAYPIVVKVIGRV